MQGKMKKNLKIIRESVDLDPRLISRGCFIFKATSRVLMFREDITSSAFKLDATPKNRAMYNHFVNGMPWEETGIIDEVLYLRSVKSRDKNLPRPTRDQVIRRYEELDRVFEDIKHNGYDKSKGAPINVAIGADNEVFFCKNGWHRLWICQHLGVESIPCRIIARHIDSDLGPTSVENISLFRYFLGKGRHLLRQKLSRQK